MADLGGSEFLAYLNSKDSRLGTLIQRVITAVNTTASSAGVAPVGQLAPPTPPDSIQVAAAGEMAQVTLTHNSSVSKGINYFTEISADDPSFAAPLVHHHGTSRSPVHITLPTKDASGTTHKYYFRAYTQYVGSTPSAVTTYGGAGAPIAVTMSGSTELDILPSTGSGTASPVGQQGGSGFGKVQVRPASGPKRNVGTSK